MQCEQCGGDCYDNRQKNQQRAASGQKPMPDFKCKDQGCGWVKWGPKPKANGTNGKPGTGTPRPSYGGRPLGLVYYESAKIATATLNQLVKDGAIKSQPTVADYVAATATLFIGARDGAPLKAPRAPAPRPEPEHEPEYDRDADEIGYDDSPLPF